MAAHALDEVGAADRDPGLRPAQQLVAGERDDVGAGLDRRPGGRLVPGLDQGTRAEVVDEGEPVPLGEACEVPGARLLGEPDHTEVRLVHAEQDGGPLGDGALVVGEPRAVGGPDLDERRPGAGEHVRDAEAVADLDQLPARDDHLAALRQGGERQQDRRGVVVDHERGLGARQLAEDGGDVVLARPPRAGLGVVLEIGVARANLAHPLERRLRQRGAPQVRVHDHARRVENPPQAGPQARLDLRGGALDEVSRRQPGLDLLPGPLERRPRRRQDDARGRARRRGLPAPSGRCSSSTEGSSLKGFVEATGAHDSDRVSR